MNNAERLKEIYKTAEESSGSAQKEQERYAESIQYSLDRLKAHGEEFWSTFIKSDDVKTIIDFLNIIIEKGTKIVDIFGSIPSITGLAGAFLFGKNNFDLISYNEDKTWGGLFSKPKVDDSISTFLNKNFSVGMAKSTTDTSGLLNAYNVKDDGNLSDFIKQVKDGNIQLKEGQSALGAYQKYLKGVNGASTAATIGTKALSVAMKVLSSIGWMALITAITWGIQKVIEGISNYVNRAEISRQKLEEVTNELSSTKSELDEVNSKIAEIQSKGKLSLTDQTELQKLQSEKSILEDQVRLLELKKELAAEKSNSDAVSTAKSKAKGFRYGNHWYDGFTDDGLILEDLIGWKKNSNGVFSDSDSVYENKLLSKITKLNQLEEKIANETNSEKKVKLYEKKAKIQNSINADKQDLSDIYSRNLELLDQITGDDPFSVAAREKLQAENEIMEKYLFTAEELVQKNLERFKSKFAKHYNEQLDLIQDDSSHAKSVDVIKGDENLGIDKTGVTESGLDGLITKTQDLNQAFVDGKINATEYFNNISQEIENINLDDVGAKLDGGKGQNANTDYIEQTIATLTSQVSDAMMQASMSFEAGEMSVGDYIDTLNAGMGAQKKLLKSTYDLKEGEDGLVQITKDMDDATKDAAESFNNLVESQAELSGLDQFADQFGDLVNQMMDAGYIEGESISEKILGDPALFSQTVDSLCGEMSRLASASVEDGQRIAQELSSSFGVSADQVYTAMKNNDGSLQTLVGNNMDAVNGMANVATTEASNSASKAAQVIGGVLDALGVAISNFKYSVDFTPYGSWDSSTPLIETTKDGKVKLNSPVGFGFNISGSGGTNVQGVVDAVKNATNYFTSGSGTINSITDWGSISGNGNDNGDSGTKNKPNKPGGGGSDKDKSSYKDPTDAVINRINLRAKELKQEEEAILNNRELAESEEDYEKQFELTNELIAKRKEIVEELATANEALHNEAEYLRNTNKWDEESWFNSQGDITEAYYNDYNSASEADKKQIEELFDKLSKYKKAYIENSKEIASINKNIINDEKHLWEILDAKLQEHNDNLDNIQSAYEAVSKALEEKNEYGDISVDTLQTLLQLEPQYLNMLSDENGELRLNEEALHGCTAAYIDNLSAQSALNLIDMVGTLSSEREQLDLLAGAANTATGSLWDLVSAKMAVMSVELDPEVFDALEGTIGVIKNMGESAKSGLGKATFAPRTGGGGDGGDNKPKVDTNYYSIVDAQIEDNNKILEGLDKEREEYNRNLEHALTMGNKEEAEIWRSKVTENAKNTKDILHSQNNLYRDKQKSLMADLHELVPDDILAEGLSWEDLTEVDITNIEDYFAKQLATSSGDDDSLTITSNKVSGIIDNIKSLDSAIEENSESWRTMSETAQEAWSSIISYSDTSSRNWIASQQAYNKLTEQEEINALQRMVDNNRRYQQQILEDDSLTLKEKEELWRQAQDNIDSYNQEIYTKQKALDLKISETYISERNKHGDWSLYGDSEYEAWQRVIKWLREKYPEELDKIHEVEHKALDARYGYSSNWISERNAYNDWALFDDTEVEAWERVVKWVHEDYPNDISKLKDAEKSLFEARKKEFNRATNFGNTYLNARKNLLQTHYDIENSIAEARHEINKELETSMTMYEYLDEKTRKLLFNQEDYNELCEELNTIEYKALRLQSEYEDKLRGATLETIESITSEYEMQYETLMKSYEIAKAELEIAKKKQQLNNVLNERNVRMFVNGSWQWVANTEDVINAKSELADAEYAKQVEEAGLVQKQSIDNLTKQQDALNLVVKKFSGGVITLGQAVKDAGTAIGYIPQAMRDMLKNAKVDTPSYAYGGGVVNGNRNNDGITYSLSQINSMTPAERSAAWSGASEESKYYLHEANVRDLSDSNTFDEASGEWKEKIIGHADGTRYTPGGLTQLGEEGFEAYITANGRLIPINQPTLGGIPSGGIVFNTEQMKNLRTLWDMSNLSLKSGFVANTQVPQTNETYDNRIIINGMTVDSGSADGQALISALRRYVGNH